MARDIKDSIVIDRCLKADFSTIYLDNVPIYEGKVIDEIEKVRLEQSKFGLQKESIVKGLNEKYESLKILDDDYVLEVDENIYSATKEQIKLLKALAIEQINKNKDYSDIVAYIFMQLVRAIILDKPIGDFEPYENASSLQIVMQTELQKFVKKKLGIKNDFISELEVEYEEEF